jgi:hypothetical protein
MVSKATACLIIALTIISPSACCCTVGPVAEWLVAITSGDAGTPQNAGCCHRSPIACTIREGLAQHGCHHCSGADKHRSGSDGEPHQCPCQEDGSGGTASPSLLDWHNSVVVSSVSCVWQAYVFSAPAIGNDLEPSTSTGFFAPKGLCETGIGILRAYGRLRI